MDIRNFILRQFVGRPINAAWQGSKSSDEVFAYVHDIALKGKAIASATFRYTPWLFFHKTILTMLLLIPGLPGSGKTYFAKAFAQKIKAKHLSSDVIRQQLELKGQYDEGIKKRVYEEMQQLTQQYIAGGATVVVDATFYTKAIRDIFIKTAEKNKVPCFIIQIKAEEETIKNRLQKKREYSEADFEVYQKIKKSFEPIHQPHLVLWSDKMELDDMMDRAMGYIDLGLKS